MHWLTYYVVPLQWFLTSYVETLRPISCGGDAGEKFWRKVVERLSSHAQITLGWFVLRCFVLQAYFVIFLSGVIWIYPASTTGKLINFMLYFCNEMRLWRLLHKGRRASASARNLGKVDKVFSRLLLRVFIALSWVYAPVWNNWFSGLQVVQYKLWHHSVAKYVMLNRSQPVREKPSLCDN